MVYVNHIDYKKLVKENGKRCANPECGKKGKKPASAFNKARDRYDGLQAYCRDCMKKKQRASRAREKPEQRDARKRRFAEKHPEAQAGYDAAYRARKKVRRMSNAELVAQMDLKDKMYSVPQALHGSCLGPFVD
jgi:hypothetical protein